MGRAEPTGPPPSRHLRLVWPPRMTDEYADALGWVLEYAVTGDLEDPSFDALRRLHRRMAEHVAPGLPRLIDHCQALHP